MHQSLQRLRIPPIYGNAEVFSQFNRVAGGVGQQASMDIPSGTPILSEKALFSVKRGRSLTAENAREPRFLALSSPARGTAKRRFDANNYEMDDGEKGIFVEASRFNHSCIPNAHFSRNTNTQQLTIHAVIDIPSHTEIFINYRPRSFFNATIDRQTELRADYGFDCPCRACQHISDVGMDQLRDLKNALLPPIPRCPVQRLQRRSQIETIIHLMFQQFPFYPELADMYDKEIEWYCKEMASTRAHNLGQKAILRQEALQAARNKLDLDIRCTGPYSSEVNGTLVHIRRFWKK